MDGCFYGRTETLALIRRRVTGLKEGYRQNMAFLGSQHIGKSAILRQFLAELDPEMAVPVYLDLEGRDIHYFVSKFIRSILYHFARGQGLSPSECLPDLLLVVEGMIPRAVSVVREVFPLMEKNRLTEAYDLVLSLPEIFSQETGHHYLVILDEFHVLEEFGIPDAFRLLAARITTQKKVLYLVASSYEEISRRILAEKLTLLFGSFEIVTIDPFDLRQSQEFVGARMGEVKVGLPLKNFLADFTGGRPLYLDIIGHEMLSLASIYKQQEIYAPLVAQAVENMLFSRWGALGRHFELLIGRVTQGKANRLVTDLLMALAEGRNRVKDLVIFLEAVTPAVVRQKLGYLVEEDVVGKNGGHYHIKDKLFRYWIKYVFLKRVRSIELEAGRLRKEFRDEVLGAISDFHAACGKDFSSRVTELLQCFDNDHLDLNGRKYHLPVFKDVKPLTFAPQGGTPCDVLQADTDDGIWLLVLRPDPSAEVDINSVARELRSRGLKPRRCVIVSPSELDDAVKLLAFEERMWVWSGSEIKLLMNLFDKPYIAA